MFRVRSRFPRRAVFAAAVGVAGVGLTDSQKEKLSIYPGPKPEILLVETSTPLEEQIGVARRHVQRAYADGHAYVQGWVSKWIGIEHAVENRVKSIVSPNESMTPGLLYVGVATLTGSILGRNRILLTRLALPPLFLVLSAQHFLPETTSNLAKYLGSLEDTYFPTLSEKHEIAKAHSAMTWERVKEATANARQQVNTSALKSVEAIQGATGLKIKETLGWTGEVAEKVEAKAVEVVKAVEKTPEPVAEAVVEAVKVEAPPPTLVVEEKNDKLV